MFDSVNVIDVNNGDPLIDGWALRETDMNPSGHVATACLLDIGFGAQELSTNRTPFLVALYVERKAFVETHPCRILHGCLKSITQYPRRERASDIHTKHIQTVLYIAGMNKSLRRHGWRSH